MPRRKKEEVQEEPKLQLETSPPPTEAVTIDLEAAPPETSEEETRVAPQVDEEKSALQQRIEELEKAEKAAKDRAAEFERQANENRRIAEERARAVVQSQSDAEQAQQDAITNAISSAQAEADAAERDMAIAKQAQDVVAEAQAQRKLARAEARLDRLEETKASFDAQKEAKKNAAPAPRDEFESSIANLPEPAKRWLRDHRDYVTDPRKNAKIQAMHYDLIDEGYQSMSQAYFEAAEQKLGLRPGKEEPKTEPKQETKTVVAAPPSRDNISLESGKKTDTKITLTAEQREVARLSMPHLSHAEAERLYAENLRRLNGLKSQGHYNQR